MSDKQKATLSLNLLMESCTAALSALSDGHKADEGYPTADFSTLRTDFLSLLAIIYAATTKVALSLKPSSPQHKASLVPLKDLSNNVASLVHSIRLMRPREGATVMAEYETVARGVISAIRSLAETLLKEESPDSTTEEYLVRTGEVHELIDNVRKSGGLSLNNRDAVRRLWAREQESFADGYDEIQDICKPAEGAGEDEEEETFDDGWEELGLSSNQKLSSAELDRAEKVQAMVKLVNLLYKRIIKDILSVDAAEKDNSILDKLAPLSTRLLAASDDLISSMYAPQQLSNIKLHLDDFWTATQEIRATILPSSSKKLEEQLSNLSLSTGDKGTKWFVTCFDQVDKTVAKILDTLRDESEASS